MVRHDSAAEVSVCDHHSTKWKWMFHLEFGGLVLTFEVEAGFMEMDLSFGLGRVLTKRKEKKEM